LLLPQDDGLHCWQHCLWQQAPTLSVAAAKAMMAAILVMVMFDFRLLSQQVAFHDHKIFPSSVQLLGIFII